MNKVFSILLSCAMILSAVILGSFFYQAQKPVRTVRVVGSANQMAQSDIMKWQITLGAFASQNNLNLANKNLAQNIQDFRQLLTDKGFNAKELSVNPAYSYPIFDNTGSPKGYNIDQSLFLTIKDTLLFAKIEEFGLNPVELYDKNMQIRSSQMQYYISALPELKKQIIEEATKDARSRAEQIAKPAKAKIGKLLNAKVGVFQITEPYSADVQGYGIYNTASREKQISVTVTCEFEIN